MKENLILKILFPLSYKKQQMRAESFREFLPVHGIMCSVLTQLNSVHAQTSLEKTRIPFLIFLQLIRTIQGKLDQLQCTSNLHELPVVPRD